jgi:hypothetical protein
MQDGLPGHRHIFRLSWYEFLSQIFPNKPLDQATQQTLSVLDFGLAWAIG